jgi:hypothetical protein
MVVLYKIQPIFSRFSVMPAAAKGIPPRALRREHPNAEISPSDVYSRIVYTLYEVQTAQSPKVQIKWSKQPSVFVHYAEKQLFLQIVLTFLKEVV